MHARDVPPGTVFYHGTKADLGVGDLLGHGFGSNFAKAALRHVYFSATLEAATWGAELAKGEGRERIYIVEPTGPFEDDPNLSDKKFEGNITASYRSLHPLRIVGEVDERSAEPCWEHGEHCSPGHSPEQLAAMRTNLARMKAEGTDTIID